jgi:hypothetical protein
MNIPNDTALEAEDGEWGGQEGGHYRTGEIGNHRTAKNIRQIIPTYMVDPWSHLKETLIKFEQP